MNKVMRFLKEEDGAAAIEYGLLAGLIAAVIVVAVTDVGTNVKGIFEYISTNVKAPTPGG